MFACPVGLFMFLLLFGTHFHADLCRFRCRDGFLQLDYPDSASGLGHLVTDILKSQKLINASARSALFNSLFMMPQPRDWYDRVFGPDVPAAAAALWEKAAAGIAPSLSRFLLHAQAHAMHKTRVMRFDKSCDDKHRRRYF
jgi:hypothetical protein